jgi:hypothetical protein
MKLVVGDVWFVNFPLEEDPNQFLPRPVIILDVDTLEVLSVKLTKHDTREEDEYDTPLLYWQNARLRFKSTARVSKTIYLPKNAFRHKIGTLHIDDFNIVSVQFQKYISETE